MKHRRPSARVYSLLAGALALFASACSEPTLVGPAPEPAFRRPEPGESQDAAAFWGAKTDQELWSLIERGGGTASIGLREHRGTQGVIRGRVVIGNAHLRRAQADLSSRGIVVIDSIRGVPIYLVKVRDVEALGRLRKLDYVEFVEPQFEARATPMGFLLDVCGNNTWDGLVGFTSYGDYYGVGGFSDMGIRTAWNYGNGTGMRVGIIDTGIDLGQPQLNSQFASGASANGRTHVYDTSLMREGEATDDRCGHGTKVASVVAGPMDGRNTVGVAWGASLHTIKAVGAPAILTGDDIFRVGQAIPIVAADSKIILMAIGSLHPYSAISVPISVQYYEHDRLFIAAAGNSRNNSYYCGFCGTDILFPARLSTVLAIAGNCSGCSIGYEVDFLVPSNYPAAGAVSLGFSDLGKISQSSSSSALFAGVAALVWSTRPTWSRDQIVTRLMSCSSFYPNRPDYYHGWGVTNVFAAAGPSPCSADAGYSVSINEGPSEMAMGATCNWSVYTNMPDPQILWYADGQPIGSGPQASYTAPYTGPSDYTVTLLVQVSNSNGSYATASKSVLVTNSGMSCGFV